LASTTCTATVTDTDAGAPVTPTGNISFATGKTASSAPRHALCRAVGRAPVVRSATPQPPSATDSSR
jgi:hypothetical protein